MENKISKELSLDLYTEILVRLPLKSLLRCRCVSKAFDALIQSPIFIALHLDRGSDFLVVHRNIGRDNVTLSSFHLDSLGPIAPDLELPSIDGVFGCHGREIFVGSIGYVNGIICFMDAKNASVVLCNPSRREFKAIPPHLCVPPLLPQQSDFLVSGCGFGYDRTTDDYKVVLLYEIRPEHYYSDYDQSIEVYDSTPRREEDNDSDSHDSTHEEDNDSHDQSIEVYDSTPPREEDNDSDSHDSTHEEDNDSRHDRTSEDGEEGFQFKPSLPVRAQIYSLKSNSWKELDWIVPLEHLIEFHFAFFFNGASHWLLQDINDEFEFIKLYCLAFDFATETFQSFDCPQNWPEKPNGGLDKCFGVLNNCLAIIQYINWPMFHSYDYVHIWVMNEYGKQGCWTKQFAVGPIEITRPLTFWNSNEEMLFEGRDGQLKSCDLLTQEIKEFDIHGVEESVGAIICKESLVQLH